MGKASRQRRERSTLSRTRRVLDAYVQSANLILPQYFRPDCCLNGTRICLDALAHFGVTAHAVACRVVVMNKTMRRLFDDRGGGPRDDEEAASWENRGAWSLVVDGVHCDPDGYAHHVVAVVPGHAGYAARYLVDSALHQYHRPDKSIDFPVFAAHGGITPAQAIGRRHVVYKTPGGADISYWVQEHVRDFEAVAGFQPSEHNVDIAGFVIEHMAERLERKVA